MIKRLHYLIFLLILLLGTAGCKGQTIKNNFLNSAAYDESKPVGGGCDGCELMYIGMPTTISSVDTSDGWFGKGQKLLVTGIVYKLDGRTPAPDVIIYYWQTDDKGYYSPKNGMDEKAKRHGHIRGWVKTDSKGKYSIFTVRPAPYPNANIPAHIHTSIKEPHLKNEYYVDEFSFDDDQLLTSVERNKSENRGGSGVLRVLISDDLQIAEHNIILGLNIPNYPEILSSDNLSGLNIGEDQPSFIPFHAWGPDKGTRACPVCKYGRFHGIIYFSGSNPDWEEIKKWLNFLEKESIRRENLLKVYFVYGNSDNYSKIKRQNELENLGQELNLKTIALTYVPSFSDIESEVNLSNIDPDVSNTFIIFRQRSIIDKYISIKPTETNFKLILNALDRTESEYFNLSEPKHD